MLFSNLGLCEPLLQAIEVLGYTSPTPIQKQAIPAVIAGKDLIATAQTGTGKTAAFVLPTLQLLCDEDNSGVQVLILCPTRELAV